MNRDIEGLRRSRVWLPIALAGCLVLGIATASSGVVITFTGGTALRSGGGTFVPNNSGYISDCTQYTEGGMRISFVGFNFDRIIGDYYSIGAGGFVGNDVIHAHWAGSGQSIVFAKTDGSPFDLTYFDLSSNTVVGGGQCTGGELSYITASNGHQMLLPSSDWGFAFDYWGNPGDGIQRLWLDSNFLGINSFTVTSQNAYCFGLDNFYIDQQAPPDPTVPEPLTGLVVAMSLIPLGSKAIRRVRGA